MKRLLLLVLALPLLFVGATFAPPGVSPEATEASRRPNIILILTDDEDAKLIDRHQERFPALRSLKEDGTTFESFFVSLALCCPSRATILRGQYAHNTEIFTNALPGGGFQKFRDLGEEESTVATWLHDAGYRTVLLGKYLNGYPQTTHVPPGWDEWYGVAGGVNFYNYWLNENGQLVRYRAGAEHYLTDVLADKAQDFIWRTTHAPRECRSRKDAAAGVPEGCRRPPFFMYLAPYAPHGPATPAPRHLDAFPGVAAPRPPSFNEADVGDKPAWLQTWPLLTRQQIANIDQQYGRRLRSMLAIDDLLADVVQMLQVTGQLEHTYIFYTADNGFHLGEHRLTQGKNTGFEEDIRVPLLVRGPGVPARRALPHLAANIDLAPTFAALAAAAVPDFVDGRSLVPLLGQQPPAVDSWRHALLLEHGFPAGSGRSSPSGGLAQGQDQGASGSLEELDPFEEAAPAQPAQVRQPAPVFQGLRTAQYKYIEYVAGARELYDLHADPNELDNRIEKADPALVARLAARLDDLRACARAGCREAEDGPLAAGQSRLQGPRQRSAGR